MGNALELESLSQLLKNYCIVVGLEYGFESIFVNHRHEVNVCRYLHYVDLMIVIQQGLLLSSCL